MPINAPQEYYDLELKYSKEKDLDERMRILKQMMIVLPKHKGSDKEFASLKRRMSMLKKAASRTPQVHRTVTIRKRWPRVCLVGYQPEDILKRFNLTKLSAVYYGMVTINDIPVQVVLIPTVDRYKELVSQSEIILTKSPLVSLQKRQITMDVPDLHRALSAANIIGIYTENSTDAVPMREGDTIQELAERLHMEIKKDTYAIVYGDSAKFQGQRVGMSHRLRDRDRVFIKV